MRAHARALSGVAAERCVAVAASALAQQMRRCERAAGGGRRRSGRATCKRACQRRGALRAALAFARRAAQRALAAVVFLFVVELTSASVHRRRDGRRRGRRDWSGGQLGRDQLVLSRQGPCAATGVSAPRSLCLLACLLVRAHASVLRVHFVLCFVCVVALRCVLCVCVRARARDGRKGSASGRDV